MTHLLIPYKPLSWHHDPVLEEFTYGDSGARARKLKKDLQRGDYVFFHTTIRNQRYVTAYYVVDRVLDTSEAVSFKAIVNKYKNPHIKEYLKGGRRNHDDAVLFGDPILSKKLTRPLLFNRALAEKLSLNIPWRKDSTENACIASATRAWRKLTDNDKDALLREIKKCEEEGFPSDIILSTDEVLEVRETDLENFIVKNTDLLGQGLTLLERQLETPEGRLDLLFKDVDENFVVVELKLNEIGRKAISQLRGYMRQIESDRKKKVRGIIICKDILPTFVNEFRNLPDVKIFHYGWKLTVYPRKWE